MNRQPRNHIPSRQRCIFLDRDGTIIVERNYLSNPNQVRLEEGVAEALALFAEAGFRLVIVSNQSGIGRGYLDSVALAAVNTRIVDLLAVKGVKIDAWYHCPHKPDAGCACRKPSPGLLDQANLDCPVDWAGSVIVGDKRSDIEAGAARGVSGILVTTGHGAESKDWALSVGVLVVDGLCAVSNAIIRSTTRAE